MTQPPSRRRAAQRPNLAAVSPVSPTQTPRVLTLAAAEERTDPRAAAPPAKDKGRTSAKRLAFGTVVMGACNMVKLAVQLLAVPLIARFLGPAEFGVYSLAVPSVIVVLMLADAGLGESLAREDESHDLVWSSAFWLLLAVGLVGMGVIAAWSFPLAYLAHQPTLPRYMAPLSISILLLVLTVPANARMFRRSNMAALAVIDLLSNLSAAVLAVVAAANHAGVWSLVLQMLTSMGIKAVAVNALAFKAPRFVFNWASVSSHTVVGGGIIAAKVADSTGKMAETGLVSRRFGSADLGSYGFATQVSWSVAQAVANPVWFAFYMQMLQSPDPRSAEDSYRRVVRLVLMLALPVAVWTAVNSHLLISRLLGPSWGGSVLLIALIFPSQVLCLCTQSVSAALYARGLTRSQFIATVVNCSMRCLAVSIPFGGFKWVAVWIGIANITYGVVGLINAKISLGWSITGVLDSLRGPLVATVAAGLEAHFIVSRCAPSLATIVVSGVMSALVYVIVLCLLDWGRVTADVQTVMGMIRRDGSASLPSARVRAA